MEIMRAMKEVSVEFRSQKQTIWDSPFDRARESWKCKNTGKGRDRKRGKRWRGKASEKERQRVAAANSHSIVTRTELK